MNVNEARQVLNRLMAGWPWAEWPEDHVALWLAALRPHDLAPAKAAAERAVLEMERPPSIAWFHKAAIAEREREQVYRPELEAAPVDKEQGKRLAAAAREALHRSMPLSLGEAIKQHRTECKPDGSDLDSEAANPSQGAA